MSADTEYIGGAPLDIPASAKPMIAATCALRRHISAQVTSAWILD